VKTTTRWYTKAISENGKIMRNDPYKDETSDSIILSNARSFKNSEGIPACNRWGSVH
jgi:hypothetical protein